MADGLFLPFLLIHRGEKRRKKKRRKKVLSTTAIFYRKEKTDPLADINKIGPFFIISPGIISFDDNAL